MLIRVEKGVLLLVLVLSSFPALAQDYVVSSDGSEVADHKAGLVWRRCPEGMTLKGNDCTGKAQKFTYDEATKQAASQPATTGATWRLPKIRELMGIVKQSENGSSVDHALFPSTPSGPFWSNSTYADDPSFVDLLPPNANWGVTSAVGVNKHFGGDDSGMTWIIDFGNPVQIGVTSNGHSKGGITMNPHPAYVRLVRSTP
jgi:hypothetical protein